MWEMMWIVVARGKTAAIHLFQTNYASTFIFPHAFCLWNGYSFQWEVGSTFCPFESKQLLRMTSIWQSAWCWACPPQSTKKQTLPNTWISSAADVLQLSLQMRVQPSQYFHHSPVRHQEEDLGKACDLQDLWLQCVLFKSLSLWKFTV
jgi:hypothetical protein